MKSEKTIETTRRVFLERENLKLDDDFVIISITNPEEREAKLDHLNCKIFRFSFDDCEETSIFYPHPVSDKQIAEILDILKNNSKVIVHCEMAFSRSPAIAIFAKNFLGFDWVNYTEDCMPNKLVYQKLVKLFKETR